jgi:hypothetical protein
VQPHRQLTAVLGGPENVKQHMYSVTQGMPSVVQMMPYAEAFGPQAVSAFCNALAIAVQSATAAAGVRCDCCWSV